MMDTQLEFIALLPAGSDVITAFCAPDDVYSDKRSDSQDGCIDITTPDNLMRIRIKPYSAMHSGDGVEVQVSCSDIEKLEYLRFWISDTLRTVLKAEHLYLVKDGITAYYSALIYPSIHRIENRLRRFLIRFFLQVVGANWLKSTAAPTVYSKALGRREKGYDRWTKMLNHELAFLDFHELGDLITKQSTGFNDPAMLSQRIREISSLEALEALKADMESNYTKYFQDTFQSNRFHHYWSDLSHTRVRVAHNGLLTLADFRRTNSALDAVDRIFDMAEARMAMIELSEREQDRVSQYVDEVEESDPTEDDYSDLLPKLTILGKIDLPDIQSDPSTRRAMTEADEEEAEFIIEPFEFMEAFQEYRNNPNFDQSRFLALSTFLNMLEDEGYNRESCKRMAYQMQKEGKVEIYAYSEPFWLTSTKAIRMV
jgi:hypothetical protein